MKKKWAAVLVYILVLTGCQSVYGDNDLNEMTIEENELNIFLANVNSDALVEVSVEVDKSTYVSQVQGVIDKLELGESDQNLKATIPDENIIMGFELKDSVLKLQVSQAFVDMDEVSLLICRSSLIKSITAIEGIDAIEFYVDGLPLKDDKGKVYGAFYPDDIITVSNEATTVSQSKSVVLYFPDSKGESLLKVDRQLKVTSGESLEKRLVLELMDIGQSSGLTSPLPVGSEVKNIHVNDGICYIDFNRAFIDNHYGGSTGELMTVYSIVNTLTEQPNISRVQFLIEGEKTANFKGHLDFSGLFEYNIELVQR